MLVMTFHCTFCYYFHIYSHVDLFESPIHPRPEGELLQLITRWRHLLKFTSLSKIVFVKDFKLTL